MGYDPPQVMTCFANILSIHHFWNILINYIWQAWFVVTSFGCKAYQATMRYPCQLVYYLLRAVVGQCPFVWHVERQAVILFCCGLIHQKDRESKDVWSYGPIRSNPMHWIQCTTSLRYFIDCVMQRLASPSRWVTWCGRWLRLRCFMTSLKLMRIQSHPGALKQSQSQMNGDESSMGSLSGLPSYTNQYVVCIVHPDLLFFFLPSNHSSLYSEHDSKGSHDTRCWIHSVRHSFLKAVTARFTNQPDCEHQGNREMIGNQNPGHSATMCPWLLTISKLAYDRHKWAYVTPYL